MRPRSGARVSRGRLCAVSACAALAAASGCSTTEAPRQLARSDRAEQALDAASDFLAAYVDPDGRVARRDQGGDTVSEGQAYGMLLALAIDDRARFDGIWRWTRASLQQPNGLFAFHFAGGRVTDRQSSADADVLIAWALVLGAPHFGDPVLKEQGIAVARAVLGHEVSSRGGARVLAAGPWALRLPQVVVEPGYWMPAAESELASATGDQAWSRLSSTHTELVRSLTDDGERLPPDWAHLSAEGIAALASAAPSGAPGPQSGQDGLRLLVWAACSPEMGELASSWWGRIQNTADAAPLSRSLDGSPLQQDRSPLSAVAAAAVAGAAGDEGRREALLEQASTIARTYPTYYGNAWGALGRVLLDTDRLTDAC